MIVVDTSALVAIVFREPAAAACRAALGESDENAISAATVVEALIVAQGRGLGTQMSELITDLNLEVVDVTEERSRLVADAYRHWGNGFHPASLNFGDCFAYALAAERGCPLLYVGNDFAHTDIFAARPE